MVLDASAVLAFLFGESGDEVVAPEFDGGLMSAVNFAEVLSRFARDGLDPGPVAEQLLAVGVVVVPFTATSAMQAAALATATQPFGLSLGERACLALAADRGETALTADRAWTQIGLAVTVRLIR
jgi:PIN domain nuclease of toxin-antitoxin system